MKAKAVAHSIGYPNLSKGQQQKHCVCDPLKTTDDTETWYACYCKYNSFIESIYDKQVVVNTSQAILWRLKKLNQTHPIWYVSKEAYHTLKTNRNYGIIFAHLDISLYSASNRVSLNIAKESLGDSYLWHFCFWQVQCSDVWHQIWNQDHLVVLSVIMNCSSVILRKRRFCFNLTVVRFRKGSKL